MVAAVNGSEPSAAALAALDIGTNSIHLVVARPVSGDRFETLTREREVVRLGSGGGDMKLLTTEALERGLACLARMKGIADGFDAGLRAVATSAVREATNASYFIERAARESGVHIEVISGVEEARLIHLGVLQAVPVFDRRLLLVDIGGGSTELLLGECGETIAARSLKVGAVRLTDRFFPGGDVTSDAVKACRNHVRSLIEHFHREVTTHGFDVAVASSGTAETVARIAHAVTGGEPLRTYNCFEVSRPALDDVVARLVKHKSAAGRRKVPGLEAHRADIIVAGSLILATIAEAFDVDSFLFSEAALREGVLLDTISRRRGGAEMHHLRDVSRRSIERLVQRCDDDPAHSIHVAKLAVALFDAIPELHALGRSAREYLEAGALLANVGLVVAHSQHHLHAYYVIRNSELAGLTDNEIEVIAQVARYHRKSEPKQSHQPFAALPERDQRLVRSLAAVLRVAIGLDRRHEGRVAGVRTAAGGAGQLVITALGADGDDIGLEVFAAGERSALLGRVLERDVEVVAG
jgi:exopolyphosphatase/guanosine-5'-triphosphate,3'-diphosphate pyrophosphatase